jgi:hypothetical protein
MGCPSSSPRLSHQNERRLERLVTIVKTVAPSLSDERKKDWLTSIADKFCQGEDV